MVTVLDSGIVLTGFELWPGHCIVLLGKTLYYHGTGQFNVGANPSMH